MGEAFYYAEQGRYFDAITRQETKLKQFQRLDNPKIDPLHINIKQAKFTLGDFELSYRMPQRASWAIRAILEGNIDQSIRNKANYRLARIYLQNEIFHNALAHIEMITGRVPSEIRDDELFLRAQVYMATGKNQEAIKTLNKLLGSSSYEGFSSYNLGIALIQNGQELEGIEQLDKTGQIQSDNEGTLAIRDKANMLLGNRLISAGQPAMAKQFLDRVSLSGPFSSSALLGSGMADATLGKFDRALVPWSILYKRNASEKAVQESMLGVPFAYSRLELHGRAALLYKSALERFDMEQGKLDAAIKSIRAGLLIETLLRGDLRQDKRWLAKIKELPATPETYYLLEMMASPDFQEALKNYLDLHELLIKLQPWDDYLEAYEGIIQIRQQHYEAILPDIDKQFLAIESKMKSLLQQKQILEERLKSISASPQPEYLESPDERMAHENRRLLEDRYKNDSSALAMEVRQRIKQDEEILRNNMAATYDKRLNEAKHRVQQLDDNIEKLKAIYSSFETSRRAATQSYQGYDNQIKQLRNRITKARERVIFLKAKQANMLETMAVNELEQRRKKLQEFQTLARFGMSESYDRASKKQLEGSGTR